MLVANYFHKLTVMSKIRRTEDAIKAIKHDEVLSRLMEMLYNRIDSTAHEGRFSTQVSFDEIRMWIYPQKIPEMWIMYCEDLGFTVTEDDVSYFISW